MVDIEKLVSKARIKIYLVKRKDDKFWCRTSEIRALLEAGATPRHINDRLEKIYLHQVSYEGIIFTNVTRESIQELEKYLHTDCQ
jgi:hypothetical protein